MSIEHNQYYKKDFRTQMMLIALLQMIGMILIPIALVLAFFNWKVAILVGVIGIIMFWKFGDLNITLGHKLITFSGSKKVDSPVIYCDIESPETAGKFRFVAENIGGLYREGDDLVLGSLNGEYRCKFDNFDYEIVNQSALVNYFIANINNKKFAIFPKWDGNPKDHPTSPEKVEWALSKIQEMKPSNVSEAIA